MSLGKKHRRVNYCQLSNLDILATECLGHLSTIGTTHLHFPDDSLLKTQIVAGKFNQLGRTNASVHGHLFCVCFLCVFCVCFHGSPRGTRSGSSHLSCLQNKSLGSSLHCLEESCCLNLQSWYWNDSEISDKCDITTVSLHWLSEVPREQVFRYNMIYSIIKTWGLRLPRAALICNRTQITEHWRLKKDKAHSFHVRPEIQQDHYQVSLWDHLALIYYQRDMRHHVLWAGHLLTWETQGTERQVTQEGWGSWQNVPRGRGWTVGKT